MLSNELLSSEFIPAKNKSQRLMIVLHALGQSSNHFRFLPKKLNLDWMNYLLVNAPFVDTFSNNGRSWYDVGSRPVAVDVINEVSVAGPKLKQSRKLIFDLLDKLRCEGFETMDITLLGFSQGCVMAVDVGLRYPKLFAGIAGISGYIHDPKLLLQELSHCARKQRVLITHGVDDDILPIDAIYQQIHGLQCESFSNIEWHSIPNKRHPISSKGELQIIRDFVAAGYSQK